MSAVDQPRSTAANDLVWQHIRGGRPPSEDAVTSIAEQDAVRLGSAGVDSLRRELRGEVLGAGPLEPLLADPSVTDVLVNGVDGVWVDRGEGLQQETVRFSDAASVRRLAVRLAAVAGARLDDACPWVDGLLPGGVRLHGILPPLVADGAHLSLRIPRRVSPDLTALQGLGMFDDDLAAVLRRVVQRRVSFVITGGTGSGKTTLLGAMLQAVTPTERIVLVEDVRELSVEHPHVVRLQGRTANVEGRGEVTLTTLVRQSLRMRPDRLVVGEVRGAEVREMMSALNTGHEGGASTLHANAIADVPSRFEALGALAGLPAEAVHAQLASAISVVIHLARHEGRRAVREIGVIRRAPAGRLAEVVPALVAGVRLPGWTDLSTLLELEVDP
ncbi:TadA family conjugal transfer-associated ATPase [Ornithinimicrobium cryptoxanthini]|uniref:TadA family conjugal transfer-associated ATPase n=1 Tax=Ornithinimicrobium cryptoxanthini TaxID=2934161 RepID=A0ABY4YJ95_9MICO|nr:TadA family conjugal transfer-associated ATPase [Ornithinimicrobium cryptoxanthini]USQ76684.1 TadA family conjugal transfer-associated ATPase [Ornithinimicrobium cryptoxanthini]